MLFLQGLKEGPEGHHGASHNELSDDYERISRFHLSQVAYLAGKLDGMPEGMPEGEGTVLDNCLQWLSNMWAGWKHDNMKVPVVLAGPLRLVVGVVITHEVGHLQIARGHSDAGSGAGFPACRFAGLSSPAWRLESRPNWQTRMSAPRKQPAASLANFGIQAQFRIGIFPYSTPEWDAHFHRPPSSRTDENVLQPEIAIGIR